MGRTGGAKWEQRAEKQQGGSERVVAGQFCNENAVKEKNTSAAFDVESFPKRLDPDAVLANAGGVSDLRTYLTVSCEREKRTDRLPNKLAQSVHEKPPI